MTSHALLCQSPALQFKDAMETNQEELSHNALTITPTSIVFKQATDGRSMEIDIEEISKAEARVQDIQCVTPSKAPELLAAFTMAWRDLDRLVVILSYQHVVAVNRLKEERSRVLVDEIPQIIKEKGLPSSKDIRDAVLDRHPDVLAANEVVQQIHCILELIKGKKEAIGMAYSSVKRIVGEGAYNMLRNTNNPNLSGDSGTRQIEDPPKQQATPVVSNHRGFGQPRY